MRNIGIEFGEVELDSVCSRMKIPHAIIYSSYEVIYQGLEGEESQAAKNALDLLKVFSFFHCENIQVNVLQQAAINPRLEKREQVRKAEQEKGDRRGPISKS
jgi:hypothetical protein